MTRKRLSPKEARTVTTQLAEIIKHQFDHNGQVITADALSIMHVKANASRRADEEVAQYGGPAVAMLRDQHSYAIVPITASAEAFLANPTTDPVAHANAVAGCGAGGARIGWYQPSGADDPLWVAYNGHLITSGAKAIWHVAKGMSHNPGLNGAKMIGSVRDSMHQLETPPTAEERLLLEAQLNR